VSRFLNHHIFYSNPNVLLWFWRIENTHNTPNIPNHRSKWHSFWVIKPISLVYWEELRGKWIHVIDSSNHSFSFIALQKIIWSLIVMNSSIYFIEEPLLSFVISNFFLKEEVSTWPIVLVISRVCWKNKIVRCIIRFLQMKIKTSTWLKSSGNWLFRLFCKFWLTFTILNFYFIFNLGV